MKPHSSTFHRLLAGALAGAGLAFAGLPTAALAGPQFVDQDGVANFGYDVVAYHQTFTATKGSADFTATHNGAPFWFASAENRDLFIANPGRFAPAYDGHCAFAVASHKKLTVDPESFSIVDPETRRLVDRATYTLETPGVLYLNYSADVNGKFNAQLPDIIMQADYAWTDCLEKLPAARPKKGLRDLFGGKRPDSCPVGP